MNVVHSIYLKP